MIDPVSSASPESKTVTKSRSASGFLSGFVAALYFAVQPALFIYLIPYLQKTYADFGVALPRLTVALIDASKLLRQGMFEQLQLGTLTVFVAVSLATGAIIALGLACRPKSGYLILLHLVGITGILFEVLVLYLPMLKLLESASA